MRMIPTFSTMGTSKDQSCRGLEDDQGSHTVSVVIIDMGIDYRHPDLQGNIWKNPGEIADNGKDDDGNGYIDDISADFFSNNDNTQWTDTVIYHVAGSIAAATNNGKLIAGVAWQTKMAALKFLSDIRGHIGAIDAVAYSAAMGFKVSNNSWGGGGKSLALKAAIGKAAKAGQYSTPPLEIQDVTMTVHLTIHRVMIVKTLFQLRLLIALTVLPVLMLWKTA